MKELKPAFRFVGFFLGLYLGLNIIYGFYISAYNPRPDALTVTATKQSSFLLNVIGEETRTRIDPFSPAISILDSSGVAIRVFEGCNGINVMIVFLSFIFAFDAKNKNNIWFLPLGIALIFIANLARIIVLYYAAEHWSEYFYYVHKYILTAFLYAIVFLLWWFWIEKISGVSIRSVVKKQE
jgi:exosortase family protein XrtF